MCGIAGFIGTGSPDDIRAMTDAIAHRGPDGDGFYCDPDSPVFLGHRRLAIVDLDHGQQPMWDGAGDVGIVFNGEIYNHAALRRELEACGHRFATSHSDTEVLIHGWKEWGRDLPARLNGMFAFAIWDRRRKLLFLARDRFGEKPLFWSRTGDLFMFASELGAFRAHPSFRAEIDTTAVAKLFGYGFIPSPGCIYRNCEKLVAGHWLEFHVQTDEVRRGAYWRFSIEPSPNPPSEAEAAEHLQMLLRQAVQARLMSDVPLGVFLSGGVDSSAVAALAAETTRINTFSVGFVEKSYDESPFARAMAQAVGSDHREELLTTDEARDLASHVLSRLDEPMADPSILPTFLLCRFTSRHVKVALSGDGGDELFAGYDTFAAIGPASLYNRLVPQPLHHGFVKLAEALPRSSRNMSLDFKIRRALAGAAAQPAEWNPRWLGPLSPEAVSEVLRIPMSADELYSEAIEAWDSSASDNPIDRTLEFYTRFYLQDGILTKVDRASMMNGLEARAVFLDAEIADFVRKLPAHYKYRRGMRKILLKRALDGTVPDEILNRKKKGFGVPIKDWLADLPAAATAAAAPTADFSSVSRRASDHLSGKADHRLFLWAWCVLQHHRMAPAPAREHSDERSAP